MGLLLAVSTLPVQAHKASDAYLQLDESDKGLAVRWDVALRDLDAALDLDTDEDGKLTWAEVKAGWPSILSYASSRLKIDGCTLRPLRQALERRNDGAYAVMFLTADCALPNPPVIRYSLFREVDPTHRGIAKVQRAGQEAIVSLLDPTHVAAAESSTATAGEGGSAASSPSAVAAVSSHRTGWAFLREGIRHILTGYDHVLFLLCLLLPSVMRREATGWRPVERLSQAVLPVAGIVSAFTVAHSITLALAATNVLSLSPRFIEPAIAVTIILAAIDNLRPVFPVRRVVVAFFFGLIHGFGFAGVLAELNLPTAQFAWALLEFNLGLELGQLMIVAAATTLLFLLRRRPQYRSWVIGGGSFAAIVIGVLWLIERTANVSLIPLGS